MLFAAVAATASQASKSQWLAARRSKQLQRTKNVLADEITRHERTVDKLKIEEVRFRLISDALPEMIVFVEREERCRYHNRAFQQWCGRSSDRIDGLPLREVAGDAVYQDLQAHSTEVLAGREIRYEAAWPRQGGGSETLAVTLLPYPPPGIERTSGFYALITPAAGTSATPAIQHDDSVGNVAIVSRKHGEAVYLQSMTEQLIGGSDPRDRLVRALQEDQFILFAQKIEPLTPSENHGRCLEVLPRLQEEEQDMLP